MKIKKFWIVTKPSPRSTKADICFQTDVTGLRLQFLGGLKVEDIHGMYTEKEEAESVATWLLDRVTTTA